MSKDVGTKPGVLERALHRVLLALYPRNFRRRFSSDLLDDYERMSAPVRHEGVRARARVWWRLLRDAALSATREHLRRLRSSRRPGAPILGLADECRSAWRSVRSAPKFAALVVFTLALGMGPATAAYSLANWLLLRPVPGVGEPDRLASVYHGQPADSGGVWVSKVSYANLQDMVPRLVTVESLGGRQRGTLNAVFHAGVAEPLQAEFVDVSYFQTLRLQPEGGRFFTSAEDDPVQGGAAVVVVSHRLAIERFGSVAAVIGSLLNLSGNEFVVIGVLPAGFHGPELLGDTDLWIPGSNVYWAQHYSGEYSADSRARGAGFYEFIARLAPGATWEQAEAELTGLGAWLEEAYPEENGGFAASRFFVYPGIGTPAQSRTQIARTLWLIMAVVGCVLAVTCANTSSLLLMRTLERRGRTALQKALGASGGRLARESLLESLILCAVGAAIGLAFAVGLLRAFDGVGFAGLFQPVRGVRLDLRVLGFAAALSVTVALLATMLPARWAARIDPARWLAAASLTHSGGGRRWRTVLCVVQLAAGVPLIVGALLFSQTLARLQQVDLGFEPGGTRVFYVMPSEAGYDDEATLIYYRNLLDQLRGDPAIDDAALAQRGPFVCCPQFTRIRAQGTPEDVAPLEPLENEITGNYFALLGIPILEGRSFDESEVLPGLGQTSDVVILSASLAKSLFGDEPAVGRFVEFPVRSRKARTFQVVGLVGDIRVSELTGPPEPTVYTVFGGNGPAFLSATVLASGSNPGQVRRAVSEAGVRVDGLLPVVANPRTPGLAEAIDLYLSERRLLSRLFTALGFVALVLAAIGVYGTTRRMVASRHREIGVRKALGADAARMLRSILGGALGMAGLGVAVGCLLAGLGVRLIESRLYGITTLDPWAWLGALATTVAIGLLAAALPARRAARIDPASALRS